MRTHSRLLALNRGHWTVENLNHRFRDTTFAEDACLMHTRHGPSNNAILNTHRARTKLHLAERSAHELDFLTRPEVDR